MDCTNHKQTFISRISQVQLFKQSDEFLSEMTKFVKITRENNERFHLKKKKINKQTPGGHLRSKQQKNTRNSYETSWTILSIFSHRTSITDFQVVIESSTVAASFASIRHKIQAWGHKNVTLKISTILFPRKRSNLHRHAIGIW